MELVIEVLVISGGVSLFNVKIILLLVKHLLLVFAIEMNICVHYQRFLFHRALSVLIVEGMLVIFVAPWFVDAAQT